MLRTTVRNAPEMNTPGWEMERVSSKCKLGMEMVTAFGKRITQHVFHVSVPTHCHRANRVSGCKWPSRPGEGIYAPSRHPRWRA